MAVGMDSRLLSDADLRWIAGASPAPLPPHLQLKRWLAEDEQFRQGLLGSDWLFRRVMDREDALSSISLRLFFEVLLRRAATDLGRFGHTVERYGRQQLPVFDSVQVTELLSVPVALYYLAEMLASFTRTQSYTVRVRAWHGTISRVRHSDIDVRSLLRMAREAEGSELLWLYKRTADVCLLVLGIFPEYAAAAHRYPERRRPPSMSRTRLDAAEYEALGQQMYGLAAERPEAIESGLARPLSLLKERMLEAKKTLNFIIDHYLGQRRRQLFGW